MWLFAHCDCGHLALFHSKYGCHICGGTGFCGSVRRDRRARRDEIMYGRGYQDGVRQERINAKSQVKQRNSDDEDH